MIAALWIAQATEHWQEDVLAQRGDAGEGLPTRRVADVSGAGLRDSKAGDVSRGPLGKEGASADWATDGV